MQPLATLRQWQLNQLRWSIRIVRHTLSSISPADATTYRDGGDGWTVMEVLGHLRDFEEVFIQRAELTLQADNPALPFPDPDTLAQEREYNALDMATVYDEWLAQRQRFIALLAGVAGDETWERKGQHPVRGPFSLNDQLFLTAMHDSLHLDQIVKILDDKQ